VAGKGGEKWCYHLQRAYKGSGIWYRLRFVSGLVLDFCHFEKIPEINQLEGEKAYFGLWFQGFQAMVSWLLAFGSLIRQHIMVWGEREREKKKRDRRGRVQISLSRVGLQWPNFLPLGPTSWSFHHFPIVPQAGNKRSIYGPLGIFQVQTVELY
jgi:hypothetical protein